MENKKDIGKAFREKLDSLHKQPGNAVWNAIKADLPKKKHRFLPLFWLEASTAIKSVVIILSLVFIMALGYIFKIETTPQNKKGEQENRDNGSRNTTGNSANSQNSTIHGEGNGINANGGITDNDVNKNKKTVSGNENNNPATKAPGSVTNVSTTESNSTNSGTVTTGKSIGNTKGTRNAKAKTDDAVTFGNNNSGKVSSQRPLGNTKSRIVSTKTETNDATPATKNTYGNKTGINAQNKKANNRKAISQSHAIAGGNSLGNEKTGSISNTDSETDKHISGNNDLNNGTPAKATASGSNRIASHNNQTPQGTTGTKDDVTKSDSTVDGLPTETGIKLADTLLITTDSLSIAAAKDSTAVCKDIVEENTTKSDSTVALNYKRLFVFAYAAPVSMVVNNALLPDATLAGNTTTTKTNFSYGAYVGYNFNTKWSARTGIAITGMEHTTHNALLHSTYSVVPGTPNNPNGYVHLMPPANYSNINYTRNGSNAAALIYLGGQQPEATVNIVQKIEFAEVPVEITYNLYDNKFGMGITAGVIAVFTTKNIVYAQNNMGNLWLGSNKNVKDVGFSGTLGLHFYYKPLPYLQINAEPVFKYYLSTFSNNTPYSYGLQVGLQYNFDLFASKK